MQSNTETLSHDDIKKKCEEILVFINTLKQSITQYSRKIQIETFEKEENETSEQSIIRAECILDRLKQNQERVQKIGKEGIETMEQLKSMKNELDELLNSCKRTEIKLKEANDTITDQLIEMKKERKEEIDENDEEEINYLNYEINLLDEERMKMNFNRPIEMFLNKQEEMFLRKWSQKKVGEILFDSYKDNWKKGNSTLFERINGKKNLLFVIEDVNGNKFGGFVHRELSKTMRNKGEIVDSKSFVFSLKENEMKYHFSLYGRTAFILCDENDDRLFAFGEGHDICVYKEELKKNSYCKKKSFNYNSDDSLISNTSSDTVFIPKKFAVIQMKKLF